MNETASCGPKDEIRRLVRARVKEIPAEQREAFARAACAHMVQALSFRRAELVLAYMPLPMECSPLPLVEAARKLHKRVAFPLCLPEGRLALYEADGEACFMRGSFGIQEPIPRKCRLVMPEEIDFAVIPGVVFDKSCNRMGRGAGYYDRMLPRLGGKKAGLCFNVQVLEQIPMEKWDIPMDFLATNNGIIVKNGHSCL